MAVVFLTFFKHYFHSLVSGDFHCFNKNIYICYLHLSQAEEVVLGHYQQIEHFSLRQLNMFKTSATHYGVEG